MGNLRLYRFHNWLKSEFNRIHKYVIYKILKRKKPYKMVNIYISEKYKKIIIVPNIFNQDGLIIEQEICNLYDVDIDDETLGIEIINALGKFSYAEYRMSYNHKESDWPAFKHSKLKTLKSFKEDYTHISIKDENGYIHFRVKYPPKNKEGYFDCILKVENNAKNCDIGKKIREICAMSEEDIEMILGDKKITI